MFHVYGLQMVEETTTIVQPSGLVALAVNQRNNELFAELRALPSLCHLRRYLQHPSPGALVAHPSQRGFMVLVLTGGDAKCRRFRSLPGFSDKGDMMG